MRYKNSKIIIFTPLVIALMFIAGIYLGKHFGSEETTATKLLSGGSTNKLTKLLNMIDQNYVDSVSKKSIVESTIPEVLEDLDPHSVYIPAEDLQEVREPLKGNFEGIGIKFNIQNDTIVVINTISGGPSEKAGILPGDRIVTINDSVFAGTGLKNQEVIKNLKGEKGTDVEVGVKRQGTDELLHFTITRDDIPLRSVEVAYMVNDSTGYIKISRFAKITHNEFKKHVKNLKSKGIEDIILDIRSNSGGLLDVTVNVTDEFLSEDKMIVYTDGRSRRKRTYHSTENGMLKDVDVVVLIDSWSASASEILAGAIQDNDRGIIVGQRSFGKGLVQEPIMFKDGSAVRLTVARYYTPTGRSIQKPYNNGEEAYHDNIQERIEHGELIREDSIDLNDSLKYKTSNGRVVYGGGGIMPDIFVPVDTLSNSDYLKKLRNKGIIYKYALEYTDNNRDKLNEFEDYTALAAFLNKQNLLRKFLHFADSNDIKKDEKGLRRSKDVIKTQIKAYIARNILGNEGFYPIIHNIDKTFQEGVKTLHSNMDSLLNKGYNKDTVE